MNYANFGSAYGRDVYLFTYDDDGSGAPPPDYSAAAVVLKAGWTADTLGWTLNALYGGLNEWDGFAPNAGARSFAFYGERADAASDLCDVFAYAWTAGDDSEYDNVVATSHDETALEAFVENMFSGEILAGNEYANDLSSIVFAVQDADQAAEITPLITAAIERHKAD